MQKAMGGVPGGWVRTLLLAAMVAGCGGGGGDGGTTGAAQPPASPGLAGTQLDLVSTAPAITTFGSPLTLSSSVTANPGSSSASAPSPTGTVEIRIGSKTCSASLNKPAAASSSGDCTLSPAEAGDRVAVTLFYSGDTRYAPSSSTFTVMIEKSGVTLEVRPSLNPSSAEDPITLSGVVSPPPSIQGEPTGTIDFMEAGGSKLCTATIASGGRAECTVALRGPGLKTVFGKYSGDGRFLPSDSAGYAHNVYKQCGEPADPTVIRPPSLCFNTAEYLAVGQTRPLTDFIVFDRGNDPLVTFVWFQVVVRASTQLAIAPATCGVGTVAGESFKACDFTAFGQSVTELCAGLPESIPRKLQDAGLTLQAAPVFHGSNRTIFVEVEAMYQRMNQAGPLCTNGQANPYSGHFMGVDFSDVFMVVPVP